MAYPINFTVMIHSKRNLNNKCENSAKGAVSAKELRFSAFYESTPVDDFLHYQHEVPFSSEKSIRVTSDLYMLFNQQRLDRMTRENLLNYFSNMSVREPSFTALKSKLSDDDLATLVKSRYIQSKSELLEWSNYLNALTNEQLQQFISAQREQNPVSEDTPAPSLTPQGGDSDN